MGLANKNAAYRQFERDVKKYEMEHGIMRDWTPEQPKANDLQFGGDHYKNMAVEPWDVVDTWPLEQQIGYYRGGALKYIMRMGAKDVSVQELKKAGHYVQKLIERLEQEAAYNHNPKTN